LVPPPGATDLSPRTVRGYTDDCGLFAAFLIDKAVPTAAAAIERGHIGVFIAAELGRALTPWYAPRTLMPRTPGYSTVSARPDDE
jgi:hypothetical protein